MASANHNNDIRRDKASTVAFGDEVEKRSKDVEWYQAELPEVPPKARELLEKYSKIPPAEVKDHIYAFVCTTPPDSSRS
jgi:hypothetical protein